MHNFSLFFLFCHVVALAIRVPCFALLFMYMFRFSHLKELGGEVLLESVASRARAVVVAIAVVASTSRCSSGRVGLSRNATDGCAANRDFGWSRSSNRDGGGRLGIGRSEALRSDLGLLEGHLRLRELRVGSALGVRRAIGFGRSSGAASSRGA